MKLKKSIDLMFSEISKRIDIQKNNYKSYMNTKQFALAFEGKIIERELRRIIEEYFLREGD